MKRFDIIKSKSCFLVVPINNSRMDEILFEVEKSISKEFSGPVIFDLLLINGNSSNRFISISFDDQKFQLKELGIIKMTQISSSSVEKLNSYHWKHKDQIMNSVLTNMEKESIVTTLEKTQLLPA